jgi:hypothetical protein
MFQFLVPKAVSAFALIALSFSIVGCASRSAVPVVLTPSALNGSASNTLNYIQRDGELEGETLSSRTVSIKCLAIGYQNNLHFKVTGKASGPFPGTFILSGSAFGSVFQPVPYQFSETFSITSGSRSISGSVARTGGTLGHSFWTCRGHGPHTPKINFNELIYKLDSSRGWTSLTYARHNFEQTFHT